MDNPEWRTTVDHINADIAGIIRAQRILSEVQEELNRRDANPLEEDFIFAEALGQDPGTPRVRLIDGVEIQVRLLHRHGLRQSDIKGADLLYEIAGHKYALVQYKLNNRGRVQKDDRQLTDLMAACPNSCPPPGNTLWPTCGAWYAIRNSSESYYLPACFADATFGPAASRAVDNFSNGISADTFDQLFARC